MGALLKSCPVWGAWIEIGQPSFSKSPTDGRRAPYGARGLKYHTREYSRTGHGRAPYGARGLKYRHIPQHFMLTKVVPRMGRVD